MSVLIEFVEWVKAEAEKSDDLIMEDARIIGKEKISAVLEAVSYRNNRLTEADSDNSEAAGSPSTVNISPLRVEANDDSPISDASNAVTVSLGQSQSIGPEPISPVSQESTDKLSFIVDLLLKYGPIAERKFKVGLKTAEVNGQFSDNLPSTNDGASELKVKFTSYIKKYLFVLTMNEVVGVAYRMRIAETLIRLLELFQTSEKKAERKAQFEEFLVYIYDEFKLKRASYFAYKAYYNFLQDHPRFQYAPIPFTTVARNINKFKEWFSSPQSKNSQELYQTEAYWKEIPTVEHNPTSKFLVDGGVDVIDFDVKDNDND